MTLASPTSSSTSPASSSPPITPTMPSSSSSSSTTLPLPRPRSSPSLHTHNVNKMNRDLSFTPVPRTQQVPQPPIMVALAGWPEPIYVSATHDRRGSTGGVGNMGFEPLSSGQVYDGVAVASPISFINDLHHNIPNPNKKIQSRPTTPPIENQLQIKGFPSSSSTPTSAIPSTMSETSTSTEITGKSDKPSTADVIRDKLKARQPPRTKNKTNPIPNIVPTPISAPNLSIFAAVCPHLTDPSLGPCPFKSHPHDVRNMFPPTSHLTSSPTSSSSSSQLPQHVDGPSSLSPQSEELSSPELDKNPQGLTNYFPVPGAGAPKPRSRAVARLNPKSPGSGSGSSSNGKRKGSTFNDPRYGAILHKGRALPVVPSWDTTPVNNGFPINNTVKGKGKEQQDDEDRMDVDLDGGNDIDNTPMVKMEVE
ncbi:hypothetical protein V865_006305 [Kwoniella europaea PYCC6329]|uniref:Uncharacterized protein n=1 Tax=Kwoniella europaea PYCC6329 TaxID=1423913 RepID=A0AAX4KQ08_9TREE